MSIILKPRIKMAQKSTRKRGANYTHEEKALLLDLIIQYKDIIESKRTGGLIIQKKKEAWLEVTHKYNSNCSSGLRDTEQLKALYDNMKQKSRKEVGENNKLLYIQQAHVSQAIRNFKEDKKERNKTGGGFWKPTLTDNDAKVLALIQDQVEPLSNPYDSAASYFRETVNATVITQDNNTRKEVMEVVEFEEWPPECNNQPIETSSTLPSAIRGDFEKEEVILNTAPIVESSITSHTSSRRKIPQKKIVTKSKNIKNSSAETLKRIYFKKKCQNADLERKKLMLEIINLKKEHNLKMQFYKNKINCNCKLE